MSDGADSYGEVAAGLSIRERAASAPSFDKRPGALEATRGLPPVLVTGVRTGDGWRVWLSATVSLPIALHPAAARKLAAELIEMAHRCELDPATVPSALARDPSPTLRAVPLPETSSGRIR